MKRTSAPIGMSPGSWAKYRKTEVGTRFAASLKTEVGTRFAASLHNEQTSCMSTAQQEPLTGSNQIPISGVRGKLWQTRISNEKVEDGEHDAVKNVGNPSMRVRCGSASHTAKSLDKSTVKQPLSGSNQIPISGLRQQLWQSQH